MTPTIIERPINPNKRFSKQGSKNTNFCESLTPIEEQIKVFESNQIIKNEVKFIKNENNICSKDTNDLDNSTKTILESDSSFIRKMTYSGKINKKFQTEDIIIVDDYM